MPAAESLLFLWKIMSFNLQQQIHVYMKWILLKKMEHIN